MLFIFVLRAEVKPRHPHRGCGLNRFHRKKCEWKRRLCLPRHSEWPPSIINSGNNEGVWLLTSSPSRRLAIPMGQSTGLPTGIKIARIVKFWAMGASTASNAQCHALVQLSGIGRGRALGYNANTGFAIEFENGVRQIVAGNID